MGSRTGIAWTDCTWNPVRGCTRVSEGCRHCYAEGIAARFSTHASQEGDEAAGVFAGFAERTPAGPRWTGRVELVPEKLGEPLRWRKPRRVFVNSMSDLFHDRLSDRDIEAVFGVMASCQHLTFQVLTKRPERMRFFIEKFTHQTCVAEALTRDIEFFSPGGRRDRAENAGPGWPWPLPNVWLGVSAEDQETLRDRTWELLKTPAAVRFVSLEPLLAPVDLDSHELLCKSWRKGATIGRYLDWVIVGGESGPSARPFDVAWARSVVEQCKATGTAVFMKQLGAFPISAPSRLRHHEWEGARFEAVDEEYPATGPWRIRLRDRSGADPAEWPADLRIREFPEVPRGAA